MVGSLSTGCSERSGATLDALRRQAGAGGRQERTGLSSWTIGAGQFDEEDVHPVREGVDGDLSQGLFACSRGVPWTSKQELPRPLSDVNG